MKRLLIFGLLLTFVALALNGCGNTTADSRKKADSPPAPAAAVPPNLFVKEAPAGAKDVVAAKKDAKEGDEIVIRGQIGGRKNDTFTDGRASFVLADMSLPACNARPGDDCPTPWDFCCETPEDLTAKSATIQVLDDNQKVLKQGLKGVNGMDHLSVIVVKGKVAKRDDPKILTVNASQIYVEKVATLKK